VRLPGRITGPGRDCSPGVASELVRPRHSLAVTVNDEIISGEDVLVDVGALVMSAATSAYTLRTPVGDRSRPLRGDRHLADHPALQQ